MKKIGLVTMFLMVMLMSVPAFADGVYLIQRANPLMPVPAFADGIWLSPALSPGALTTTDTSASMFCDPNAKGLGDANSPNGITATYTSASMFCDPNAKGLGDVDKSNGVYLSPALGPVDVTLTRINMFTGEPF